MAHLLPCPTCKSKVSEAAPACPKCGHPLAGDAKFQQHREAMRKTRGPAKLVVALLFGGVLVYSMRGNGTSYADLPPVPDAKPAQVKVTATANATPSTPKPATTASTSPKPATTASKAPAAKPAAPVAKQPVARKVEPVATTKPAAIAGVGSDVLLNAGDKLKDLFLGRTKDDFDRLLDAVNANDDYGKAELLLAGRVFMVPRGTRARIIGVSWTMRQVRILEGERIGAAGWVPLEWAGDLAPAAAPPK